MYEAVAGPSSVLTKTGAGTGLGLIASSLTRGRVLNSVILARGRAFNSVILARGRARALLLLLQFDEFFLIFLSTDY